MIWHGDSLIPIRSQVLYEPIFEPCKEIPVYINDVHRHEYFLKKVEVVLKEISNISKTRYSYAGYTSEIPTTPFYPKWPQKDYVVIALIDRWQSNIFPSNSALAATTSFKSSFGVTDFHASVVVVDRAAFNALSNTNGRVRSKMTVVRHELGHVAGFGHDPAVTIMNANALNLYWPIRKLQWPTSINHRLCAMGDQASTI